MKKIVPKILPFLILSFLLTGCSGSSKENSYTSLVEGKAYSLSSPVSDRLVRLDISEGDRVEAEQILGRIDTESLELQKNALESKLDQLQLQRRELELTIAQIRDTRDHFRSTYEKNLELLKVQAISDQTVKDLKLNVDKWARDYQGQLLKRETLDRQEEEMGYSLKGLDLMIARGELKSPAGGYVDKVFYETGEYVPPLHPVVQVINLEKVWCYIYVGESVLFELTPGQKVEASSGGNSFRARVEHINSRAEFTPKEVLTPDNRAALAYAVKIGIDNPEGALKIGMPVNVGW